MSIGRICTLLALAAAVAAAQSDMEVQRVELAQPGGTVFGKLMTLGDNLVFVDDNQVNASFSIPRSDIRDMRVEGGLLIVELAKPVRDRTGQSYRLAFRMRSTEPVDNWWRGASRNGRQDANPNRPGQSPTVAQPEPPAQRLPPSQTGPPGETHVYDARHNHFLTGGCNGKLLVTPDRLIYESVDDSSHSRQWQYSDVREMHRGNHYELEIKPFTGSDYKLKLLGQALDAAVYQSIVDRVVRARVR